MNKLFSHIVLLLLALTISSTLYPQQSSLVFFDNFDNNENQWNVQTGNGYTSYISNGKIIIKSPKDSKLFVLSKQIFIDYRKNFSIETSMKYLVGPKNKGFGLTWGSKDINYSYIFLITNNQYFTIGMQLGKKYYKIAKWTKSKVIKPNDFNILKIEKNGIVLTFYINGKPVYSTQFLGFLGQYHGFALQSGLTVEADYFQINSAQGKINIATDLPFISKRIRLPETVNTPYSEIAPIISPDGKTLYFGRIYDPQNYGDNHECDIWYSKLQPDGTWGPAIHAPKPLNNNGVNVVITVTPDGNALLLEGLYNPDGSHKSEQGISISYKTQNGWSVPEQVKIKNFQNKNIFETYCLSNDFSVLIMSVERDDSYGDLDLYVSFRQPDGTYSEPVNMGPVINTFASESTPYLASDGKTLYFSSNGHPGFGSHDIFVTKRLDDTWTNWTTPQNLGPAVNTYAWDTYLSIPAKGDYAYLSSTFNSIGNEDIFKIKLDTNFQPEPVILIYGKVYDKETNKPILAQITWTDLSTGKQVGIARTNPTTGEYKITLPFGKIYGLRAEAQNYIAQSDNLDLRKVPKQYAEKNIDLFLVPFKADQVIKLNNVFFYTAKAELMPESYPELQRLVKLLKDNPTMVIELHGHTDYRGDPQKLYELSLKRVETVKNYLISHGIEASRIKTKAFGGKKPVYKGDDEELHKLNRRVEFKILKL